MTIKGLRRLWLAMLSIAVVFVVATSINIPHVALAQTSPCVGYGGSGSPTYGGSTNPIIGGTPNPVLGNGSGNYGCSAAPTPSGVINSQFEPADQLVDSIGMNTAWCANGANFGNLPSPYPIATDGPPMAYLKVSGIRHVRDGYFTCSAQASYNAQFTNLHTYEGIDLIGTNANAYTISQIQNALTTNPAIRTIGFGNEWDVHTFNTNTILATPIAVGGTTVTTPNQYLFTEMVPGSLYSFGDTNYENFNLTSASTNVVGNTNTNLPSPAGAFQYPHAGGTQITRLSTWYNDAQNWYAYYAPQIRYYQPTMPIFGPSLAFPLNAQSFVGQALNGLITDIELHDYSTPMGENPEGPTGDGTLSYTPVSHGVCSNNSGTSSSWGFNTCSAMMIAGVANPQLYIQQYTNGQFTKTPIRVDSTEYSYVVVPIGDAYESNWPNAIPEDTAVDYMARSYFFGQTHNRSTIYWFNMINGTSGSQSGFCPYGVMYFGGSTSAECNNGQGNDPLYPSGPTPKAEYQTMRALAQYFTDPGCHYPTCSLGVPSINISWSDPSLPLQEVNLAKASGAMYVVFWLGAHEYDPTQNVVTGLVNNYLSVTPRTETVTVPMMTSATLEGFDANGADPTPTPAATTAPDGAPETVALCPTSSITSNCFGGLLPTSSLTVSHAGTATASVTVTVTKTPQWLIPVISGMGTFPTPAATTTPNVVVANANPPPYPGAIQATPAPSPTASPTPNPNLAIVAHTQCMSGNVAPNKTFTCNYVQTPAFGDTLIAYVSQGGTTQPAGAGSVNLTNPSGYANLGSALYSGGNFGQAGLFDHVSTGTETSITMTNSASETFNYYVDVFEVSGAASIQNAISTTSSLVAASPSLTNTYTTALSLAFFGVQNSNTGPATGLGASLGSGGWTLGSVLSSGYTGGSNNITGTDAYVLLSISAPQQQTATISGTNLSSSFGTAALVVVDGPTPAPTATPVVGSYLSVAHVSTCNSGTNAASTSFTCTLVATPVTGRLLVAVMSASGTTVPGTDTPSGWTSIYSRVFNTIASQQAWKKTSTGSETSLTLTDANPQNWAMQVYEIAYAGTVSFQQVADGISGCSGNGTTMITPASAPSLVINTFSLTNTNTGPGTSLVPTFSLTNYPTLDWYTNSNWYPASNQVNGPQNAAAANLVSQITAFSIVTTTATILPNMCMTGTNFTSGTGQGISEIAITQGAGP